MATGSVEKKHSAGLLSRFTYAKEPSHDMGNGARYVILERKLSNNVKGLSKNVSVMPKPTAAKRPSLN